MLRSFAMGVVLIALGGCALPGSGPVVMENPAPIPPADPEYLWMQIVDVVDDYFRIQREERVRILDDVQVEGRIDTYPEISATLLEPWRGDTVTGYDRLESTLQTMRRYAVVRVIPQPEGYLVDVAVFKELEDLEKPDHASAAAASFRNDSSPQGFSEPVGEQPFTLGWIRQGRDTALEQQILSKIQYRLSRGGNCN